MALNLNDAEGQTDFGDLIPDGTIAPMQLNIKPGNAGDDGWATHSKNGETIFLAVEFTILEGQFARRKFWSNFVIDGKTEGQKKAVNITMSRLRGIVESAKGIQPGDESETARSARNVEVEDLDGIRFVGKVSIEKGKDNYPDRNGLRAAVTPDSKDWKQLEQIPKQQRMKMGRGNSYIPAAGIRPVAW